MHNYRPSHKNTRALLIVSQFERCDRSDRNQPSTCWGEGGRRDFSHLLLTPPLPEQVGQGRARRVWLHQHRPLSVTGGVGPSRVQALSGLRWGWGVGGGQLCSGRLRNVLCSTVIKALCPGDAGAPARLLRLSHFRLTESNVLSVHVKSPDVI